MNRRSSGDQKWARCARKAAAKQLLMNMHWWFEGMVTGGRGY
jgi:hypothetical protein